MSSTQSATGSSDSGNASASSSANTLSSSSTSSLRTSSLPPSTSSTTPSPSPAPTSSSLVPTSSSARTQSIPPSASALAATVQSASLPSSSASQITSPPSTDANDPSSPAGSLSHSPSTTIVAAVVASVAGVAILALLAFVIWRRRRAARKHLLAPSSAYVMRERDADEGGGGDFKASWLDSGRGWPDAAGAPTWEPPQPVPLPVSMRRDSSASLTPSGKMPHYTVRSRQSYADGGNGSIHGFGQDLAWQAAHYEDVEMPPPPKLGSASGHGDVPPTPPSAATFGTTTPLLRRASDRHSIASSVSSAYSASSMNHEPADVEDRGAWREHDRASISTARPPTPPEVTAKPTRNSNLRSLSHASASDEHSPDRDWTKLPLP